MPKKTAAEKAADARVDASFRRTCSGVQIDIMDIGKVFKAGRAAVDAGADDTALDAAIAAFVATIRRN